MPRESYQAQLEALREDVLYMSEVVLERLRMGLDALARKDDRLARKVIEGDDEINGMYLDLEGDCIDLFALQQPVAGDLRFIASSFKVITDLERIADLATNLGEYTFDADRDVFPEVDVQAIGEFAETMVADAMAAYAAGDAEACYAIDERDTELDERCERASDTVVRELIGIEGDPVDDVDQLMTDVSRLLLTIRDLERVGDHAVNISARTLYMVENDDELIF
ncbi:phosphate signaling complex protein PhoU [Halococcus sp. IIIV-5B]|uniref:phosphate signaling complex protein PhoU n=1 Tax=Halococcus sp. IIIV-5B TaxID=2321230 RepID=UPI000E72EBAB|nr:phosphate signaling complex protein PhoU [Halococcus sp. IIIV-5B]RJS96936.1 phosphate transport system regulatory protein PhoU [Halococcus sp. IIIV-5B]